LSEGASLLADDPGIMVDGDGNQAGTTRNYNSVGSDSNLGWRYGFVAFDGSTRTYSSVGKDKNGTLSFTVPSGTTALYLVVQGSPETYVQSAWDEDESTDAQFPYSFKVVNTNIEGYFDIDETQDPKDVALSYDFTIDTTVSDGYELGSINLAASVELCQAFVLTPDVLTSKMAAITNGSTYSPEEGKIVMLNRQTDGSLSGKATSNLGYWLDADGNVGNWGDNGYSYYEISGAVLTYGQYPGHPVAGTTYQLRPTLVYTTNGKQYKADITINLKY
jgi:hypothetical protein